MLTREELEQITGVRGAESRELGGERHLVAMGGERLVLQLLDGPASRDTLEAALARLAAEVDLPLPRLRASGELAGQPWALLEGVGGEPLSRVMARLTEEQLYGVGRRLGEIVFRVHRLAGGRYGALAGDDPCAADEERGYVAARAAADLELARERELLDEAEAAEVQEWLAGWGAPGRAAALLVGGLDPGAVLVRESGGRWGVGGLLGWERALSWSPGWDHVGLLEAAEGPRWFGLRVGYGNGYDELTQRHYEQVREAALRPYRVLLALRRAIELVDEGEAAAAERRKAVLLRLIS